jgi:PBP1b-binding outer membrane lipoprotein LpoB
MKTAYLAAAVALASLLYGCSGEAAPTEVKDQLAEMNSKVPPGLEPVPPEQAQAGFQKLGGSGRK